MTGATYTLEIESEDGEAIDSVQVALWLDSLGLRVRASRPGRLLLAHDAIRHSVATIIEAAVYGGLLTREELHELVRCTEEEG